MSLFEDNFDWEHIRKDFLHGVLSSDILMKNIHCHIISDGYAARVRDTKSYDAIRLIPSPLLLPYTKLTIP